MNWIKHYPGQSAVAALSVALAISTTLLYRSYSLFPQGVPLIGRFGDSADNTINPELPRIDSALTATAAPGTWSKAEGRRNPRLFAGARYLRMEGHLVRPEGTILHGEILYDWLARQAYDPLDPKTVDLDPDHDGFTNLLEWRGADGKSHLDAAGRPVVLSNGSKLADDSTDPSDPASHPPYHTRLFVERIERIPFKLRFQTYDINPRNPKDVTVQINTPSGRSEYCTPGSAMTRAPFDVREFTKMEIPDRDGTTRDVSTVVVVDRRSGAKVTLQLGRDVDSPESYAILRYDCPTPMPAGSEGKKIPSASRGGFSLGAGAGRISSRGD